MLSLLQRENTVYGFFFDSATAECNGFVDTRILMGITLTNRFHVVVRLFSNRSQMTSKCGENKKVAHEAIAECVTDVLTTF